ncbi:o-succinylbenzoate synthase [Jeotgalibacillus campisalis]|uniref:o-succinylbenzoate synthase n=1 Tax=Jeotgalibacillus campisalis TaxID=220754 RepID=A0A0C2RV09_9BACL|nr:o-succinylbenzoate synthase [Jeotgalibacillus campisalis]KIL45549.1 O-succinylbenzoic acid (OSB) synthetase [Jeotgalibacillus campisalis]
MNIIQIDLHVIEMELVAPFVTSLGSVSRRKGILVEAHDQSGLTGYGEAVAFSTPWYTEETVDTCFHMLKDILAPLLLKTAFSHPEEAAKRMSAVRKNPMAKAALDMAVWDLYAKKKGVPLAQVIGGTRKEVLAGIAVGAATTEEILAQIKQAQQDGYKRVKVKIGPENDLERIQAIRETYPDMAILADANSSYSSNEEKLDALDQFDLQMIEQPLHQDDLVQHAALQKKLKTPICLDESITSFHAAWSAIQLGSCQAINIKIGRVGGVTEALRIHDLCVKEGIQVWCGGMLEFGVSRAHNIALATLKGFSIPGDISSSARYWKQDITTPEVKVNQGIVQPFQEAGIGVEIDWERVEEVRIHHEVLK